MNNPVIIVEGRDDLRAVKEALPEASVICTHGFGISEETWRRIETASKGPGIIILTDPDKAGEDIRRRITARFPKALHAFLPRREAVKEGDVGIENAAPEAIRRALEQLHAYGAEESAACGTAEPFTEEDLQRYGLAGGPGASARRAALGKALGIGYGNGKAFLSRLNGFGISRQAFEEAAKNL